VAEPPPWHIVAARWWRDLQPDEKRPDPSRRAGNRAALARLRRCTRLAEAGAEPAALDLARQLGVTSGVHRQLEKVLLAAIVLAHVREDDPGAKVARRLGAAEAGQRAPMSPLRLARLLSADTTEEQLIAFRRAVALLGGRVPVADLARALLNWSENTRIAWAFEYHNVLPPNPQSSLGDAA
jgi:CRISPR system Cascade subunit CasB